MRGFWICFKKVRFRRLIRAIKTVSTGAKYICVETAGKLKNLNQFLLRMDNNLKAKDEVFSQREKEVLNQLSEGRSSKEIAHSLFITERTVESHRKNMIQKSKVKNTVELIAYASSIGVISLSCGTIFSSKVSISPNSCIRNCCKSSRVNNSFVIIMH
jgi:DNA-binding NarL/FixJ family response regulator